MKKIQAVEALAHLKSLVATDRNLSEIDRRLAEESLQALHEALDRPRHHFGGLITATFCGVGTNNAIQTHEWEAVTCKACHRLADEIGGHKKSSI